jgi:hypothetical protein
MEIMKKRIAYMRPQKTESNIQVIENSDDLTDINLLGTIKLPKNLSLLTKNLPKSNYQSLRQSKLPQGS